ncbi:MAG: HAD family phosphatase [Verrucomicrobiota bacterium]|nr:HAD family phosphatase [Verrucomicrobiota bacterium]
MTKIRAIIFDMDGVLIDAREWHFEALNRALGLFGLEISRYDHLTTFDGLPTRKKLQLLSLEKGLPPALHSFINEMKQIYTMEIVHARCKPVFCHEFALSRLRQDGYSLVVCSNAVRASVRVMMERACLLPYLEFFLSNEDVERAKPDPDIYNKAIAALKRKPEECLVVEDNENGVKAALASGSHLMKVNGVQDVHYAAIKQRIAEAEGQAHA